MKKWKKLFIITLVLLSMMSLCGCGFFSFNEENTEVYSPASSLVFNTQYKVVDLRETFGGNNVRHDYLITLILEDNAKNRFYYEYEGWDKKSDTYKQIACFTTGDNVIYINSDTFTIVKE